MVLLPAPFSPTRPERLSGREPEAQVSQGPLRPGLIAEGDVLEGDLERASSRNGRGRIDASPLAARGDQQEREEVGHVEGVLVHGADGGEDSLEGLLALPEDHQVEGHVAERDLASRRPPGHEEVHPVERSQRQDSEGGPGRQSPDGQSPVLAVELPEEFPVTPQDERPEVVELDLLHVRIAGEDPLEVVEPAPFRRAPRVHPEGLGGEPGLGDEGGDRGPHDDEHAPGGEPPEQGRQRRQGHRVLRDPEGLHHQGQRPGRGLPAGVLHLVVDVGVLEVAQLEGEGLRENLLVHPVAEVCPEQLAQESKEPPGDEGRRHEQQLQEDERPDSFPGGVRTGADRLQHGVDDELSHPGERRGQERGQRGESRDGQRASPIRLPDQPKGARELGEDLDDGPHPAACAWRRGRGGLPGMGGGHGRR